MNRPGRIDTRMLAPHIAADVDRAAPLFARVLLVHAIWDFGGSSLWVVSDLIADCGTGGEFAAASATTRELARSLVPDHDVDRDLGSAIAAVQRINGALRSEESAYSAYSLVTDPDLNHIDGRQARETWARWRESTDRTGAAVHELPQDLGEGWVGSLLLDKAIVRVFRGNLAYRVRYQLAAQPHRLWRGHFVKALLDASRGRRQKRYTEPSDAWTQPVMDRLDDIKAPLFSGREPLTAEKVTAIRLAALCLAHEARSDGDDAAGEAFGDIVVRITEMEREGGAVAGPPPGMSG